MLGAAILAACASGPATPSQTATSTSTTTTSIAPLQGLHYLGTLVQPAPLPDLPLDLSLFFNLPGAASGTARPRQLYSVYGGYNTGLGGFSGSIRGTLDGTLDNGLFSGEMTADLQSGCTARRSYAGPLTRDALSWTPGEILDSCGGTIPLAAPVAPPAAPPSLPPTTTTTIATTTSSTASSSTTTSIAPVPVPQPTSTSTIASGPVLTVGTLTVKPSGTGLASATAFAFDFDRPPSGGLAPYHYTWTFGDVSPAMDAQAPTHVFANPGTFTVTANVTDQAGRNITKAAVVTVGSATGTWRAEVYGSAVVIERIVITQTLGTIAATATDQVQGLDRTATGDGSVFAPSGMLIYLTYSPFGGKMTFSGSFDAALSTWTGQVTGGLCDSPCSFTATR